MAMVVRILSDGDSLQPELHFFPSHRILQLRHRQSHALLLLFQYRPMPDLWAMRKYHRLWPMFRDHDDHRTDHHATANHQPALQHLQRQLLRPMHLAREWIRRLDRRAGRLLRFTVRVYQPASQGQYQQLRQCDHDLRQSSLHHDHDQYDEHQHDATTELR